MNHTNKSTTRVALINLLLLFTISACSGGGDGDSPEPKPEIPKTPCEQLRIDTDQTCTTTGGRAVINYAPASQDQYSGLAIFLHGAPGTPIKVSGIFDAKMLADKFNLVSLAPQGNGTTYQWNSTNNSASSTPDVDHLLAVIDNALSQYAFTDNKVYIFGYSAGGFMAYKLACNIPERLTAVISLAGQFRGDFDNCPTSTPLAIHHMHSVSDSEVPFSGRANGSIASVFDTLVLWQQKNGCGTETEIFSQEGVTESSTKTDTEIYTSCVKSIGLSKLDSVSHEDNYIAEKLLATYEYLLNE